MGNTCCKAPQDELILEAFENTEANNNQTLEDTNKVKDKYPHDSDSAFKPRKYEEIKTNINPAINKIEEEPRDDIENGNVLN